jgi:hypothetical protein
MGFDRPAGQTNPSILKTKTLLGRPEVAAAERRFLGFRLRNIASGNMGQDLVVKTVFVLHRVASPALV